MLITSTLFGSKLCGFSYRQSKIVVTFYLRQRNEFQQSFPAKNLSYNWFTCLAFGGKWLELISQSQIKGDCNFSNPNVYCCTIFFSPLMECASTKALSLSYYAKSVQRTFTFPIPFYDKNEKKVRYALKKPDGPNQISNFQILWISNSRSNFL